MYKDFELNSFKKHLILHIYMCLIIEKIVNLENIWANLYAFIIISAKETHKTITEVGYIHMIGWEWVMVQQQK